MRHYIIYLPGLGDRNDGLRRFLLWFWRIYGLQTKLVPMQWYDGRTYEEKYARVVTAIKRAEKQGYTVSVIGESAGGSMAMNVFSRTPSLYRLVSLCGVNLSSAPVSPHIYARSAAFKQSVSILTASGVQAVQDRADRITLLTGLTDLTVPAKENIIKGVRRRKIIGFGHIPTILLCLSIYSFVLVREIKR